MRILLLITWLAVTVGFSAHALDRNQFAEQASAVTPLLNGQSIPDVTVQTFDGKSVNLKDLVSEKPTVILFYRGGWCPYCNRQLAGLKDIEKRMVNLGYQILAISPESPERLQEQKMDTKFAVTLISDNSLEATKAFGIGFFLPEEIAARSSKIGADATLEDGSKRRVLPAPAIFIADQKGLIKFNYVNPDYKVRISSELLFQAARLSL
ncbi:AhpC/TSA family protein [Alteromonadaceae bacterium M269]|nr:AhpC/TSA family protein [Alteromonadaceae bacterium M269]